jgi:F0F1-type ATP synthase assembly protein I
MSVASPPLARSIQIPGGRIELISRVLLYAAVAYTALSTVDVHLDSIPLKLLLVIPALALWSADVGIWQRWRDFAFRWPVVVVAVVVPVTWFALATWLHHNHDAAQQKTLHYAVQEASRFVYLLLYFPIVAEMRRGSGWSRSQIWFWPVLVLTMITWGLLLSSVVFGVDYGTAVKLEPDAIAIGPFQGEIGSTLSGTFQAFLTSDVLMLPGFALLLADLLVRGLTRSNAAVAALLLSATYLMHSRGVWLGVCLVCGIATFALWSRDRGLRLRRACVLAASLLSVALLVVNADPPLVQSTVKWFAGGHELSIGSRL